MEKRFEDAFKEKFDGAELPPSEAVWNNIELELARAEGGDMKRRILFFKFLAAASVAFAMCFTGASYYYMQKNLSVSGQQTATRNLVEESQLANTNSNKNTSLSSEENLTKEQNQVVENNDAASLASSQETTKQENTSSSFSSSSSLLATAKTYSTNSAQKETLLQQVNNGEQSINMKESFVALNQQARKKRVLVADASASKLSSAPLYAFGNLPACISNSGVKVSPVEQQADPVAVMMAQLAEREKELREDKKESEKGGREKLWASVAVAAGAFNTISPGVSSSARSMSFTSMALEQSDASGLAYSMGISLGTQISSRWVLQGGVNYLTQSYDYTANSIATSDFMEFEAGSLNAAQHADTKLIATSDYNVNNSMQFVSVPLQAGYMVVNKRVGILVNAGVATDFFIRNTVAPSNSNLSKTTQGNGEDSPYRPLNFSGLMSTEFSYQLGKQYRVALSPGVRYPFSSIYKESTGISSNPLTVDVGLKFRYLFQ